MITKMLSRIPSCKSQMVLQRLDQANKCTSSKYNNILQSKERTFLPKSYDGQICINYNTCRGLHTNINFHSQFKDNNMLYARDILANSKAYSNTTVAPLNLEEYEANTNFEDIVGKNWTIMNDEELIKNFKILTYCASKTNESIHDPKCQEMLKVLSVRCSSFNDAALWDLLSCLEMWYIIDKVEPGYLQLWKAIDKQCLERMPTWSLDEIFLTNDHFYKLRLLRASEFTYQSLKKICRKITKLSSTNMVQLGCLLAESRKIPIHMYEMEHVFETHFDKLSVAEIGVVASFFAKYEYTVKSNDFQLKLIELLNSNINTISDNAMKSIFHILGYSDKPKIIEAYTTLNQSLKDQVLSRPLGITCHILSLQKRIRFYDEDLILALLNRFEAELKDVSLKMLSKIINTLNVFSYDSSTTPFYSLTYNELLDPNRAEAIRSSPNYLVDIVLDMLRVNFYPKELLVQILTPKFIKNLCKDNLFNLERNYLIIDYIIKLDHPEYDGPRLENRILQLLLKRFGAYHPDTKNVARKQRSIPKCMPEVKDVCQQVIECKSAIYTDYLLPYVNRSFIVLCYDQEANEFVSTDKISQIPVGEIKYAPDDGKKWIAIGLDTYKIIVNATEKLPGMSLLELRHLQRIGYKPISIHYKNWEILSSYEEKKSYLKNILYR